MIGNCAILPFAKIPVSGKGVYSPSVSIWQPETITQKNRIEADGGVVIDFVWMDQVIYTLKSLGIYSNCKLLADANFGVKKDGTGAVSKLYDISGNNNDAVQATGSAQPIWSLNGGTGIINYNGITHDLSIPNHNSLNIAGAVSIGVRAVIPNRTTKFQVLVSKGGFFGSATTNYGLGAYNEALWVDGYSAGVRYSYSVYLRALDTTSQHSIFYTYDLAIRNIYFNGNNFFHKDIILATMDVNTSVIYIGFLPGRENYFVGQLNSYSVFNTTLTPAQVLALKNIGL